MHIRLVIILLLVANMLYGQSLEHLSTGRTVEVYDQLGHQFLDSLRYFVAPEFTAIKNTHDSISKVVEWQSSRLNQKIDSLRNLSLSIESLTQKLDSINQWKDEKLRKLTARVEQLKATVNDKIARLKLPDNMQSKAAEITKSLDKLDVTLPNIEMPFSLDNNIDLDIPSLNVPGSSELIPKLSTDNIPKIDLGSTGAQIQQYQQQLGEVPKSMDDVAELVENKATSLSEISKVQSELGEVNKLNEMIEPLKDQDAMKEKLMQEVKQQAVDHMGGQEEKLMKAMETLAKYKQKYSKVTGLDELPKRRPNEMRGKPLRERLLPGLALQVQRKDDWMVDFNPYVGYRFNPQLTIGAGWNQRVVYSSSSSQINQDLMIYGPRTYGEYNIGKGFSGRLEVEYMNTWVEPKFSSSHRDSDGREWVFSAMAGIKKDYNIYKNIKGTFMALYNLYDPHFRSPYSNKLNLRVGFEFPMRKKMKNTVTQ